VTVTPSALDTAGQPRKPATSTSVHAVCGDLTVTFEVRYGTVQPVIASQPRKPKPSRHSWHGKPIGMLPRTTPTSFEILCIR
jgi:hypothetical protein